MLALVLCQLIEAHLWHNIRMKLLLTSNGFCNESIKNALREMLDKPVSEATIVFVPAAADPVRGDKTWLVNDMYRAHSMGWKRFEVVHIVALADWPKEMWLSAFEEADVIMFCGGHTEYLSYALQKSGLAELLPNLLNSKVYVGISAGSMIATDTLITSSGALATYLHLPEDESKQVPPGFSSDKGLGLVDFLFRPHLDSPLFPLARKDILEKLAVDIRRPIYLVDDETAVRVVDGKADVISEGVWHLL